MMMAGLWLLFSCYVAKS